MKHKMGSGWAHVRNESPRAIHRLWVVLFFLWIIFLSGVIKTWVGTPGVYQAIGLRMLLDQKVNEREQLEKSLASRLKEITDLEKNRLVQEREIRRVLGYTAPGELVFDFPTKEGTREWPKGR